MRVVVKLTAKKLALTAPLLTFPLGRVTRVVGDVIIVGKAPLEVDSLTADDPWSPLLARLSFSAGLALSARLSSQETSLSKYLQSVQPIPQLLSVKGRVPISRREVVRKMGRLLKLRQMVNLEEGSKVEELELFWENARMEQHYDSICTNLDIESRFRALNEQLDHAENLMGILRALLTEGSSHRMELIIIARKLLPALLRSRSSILTTKALRFSHRYRGDYSPRLTWLPVDSIRRCYPRGTDAAQDICEGRGEARLCGYAFPPYW